MFLHINLVTSLSTADLTPNFAESNYIYHYHKWYDLCNDSTNSLAVPRSIIQTLDKNSCHTTVLQVNIISQAVTMNTKIKKPPVKSNF